MKKIIYSVLVLLLFAMTACTENKDIYGEGPVMAPAPVSYTHLVSNLGHKAKIYPIFVHFVVFWNNPSGMDVISNPRKAPLSRCV